MNKTTLVVINYVLVVVLVAFFLDILGAESNMKKGLLAL